MSEELVNHVSEMLKEEKWTRSTVGYTTKNNLIELAGIVEKAKAEGCEEEIKELCDNDLKNSKDNSIAALYLSGMINLSRGTLDNSNLVSLVEIFEKNHKEPLIEYLCIQILDEDPQNMFALRRLAEYYKSTNDEKVWELYEKIVKIDFEEADIAKILAERYDSQGNQETAVSYYKKALLRYVSAKNINSVKEIWSKLCKAIPDEIDFFLLVQKKIAKNISETKSALLMQELYQYYRDTAKWDTAIDILRLILEIDPKDGWARKEITECFRGKYADHSHLEDYIKSSNLNSSFRNVFEAINDFEKHIAFDAKNFVYHRSWGVGIIRKVQGDNLTINFGKKGGIHDMSLKMAVSALQPLAKDHIWVLKATKTREELAKKVKEDKSWALKTIINSFKGSCDDKKIKAELVPQVLTAGEWTSWHTAAQKILATDSTFGVSPNNINVYIVRDHEIPAEEKLANEFKAEKQFFARIDILMRYVNDDATDKSNDLFSDMFNYFAGYLKSFTNVNEQVLASYLVVQRICKSISSFVNPAKFTFEELYDEIENPCEMYTLLKDTKNTCLKADFLQLVRLTSKWDDNYVKLFPTVLKQELLTSLLSAGKEDKVKKLAKSSFEDFRDYREAAIYFFKECRDEEWFKNCGLTFEREMVSLIDIIAVCYREINNHVNSTENKKIIKAATLLLFKDNTLLNYMLEQGPETCTKLYTMVNDVRDLDATYKAQLRNGILNKYKDFKFQETETKQEAPKGLMVTAKALEEKKALAEDIEKVQIPANAIEVSEARAKGDLKENAEYTAAKEHQHYLNTQLKRIKGEIGRAVIFDPTTITTSLVSFGTKVTLHNENENKDEVYSIFGPWESNPDEGIISYLSPFGNNLLDAKVGEKLEFTINEHKYVYTVKNIEIA